MVFADNIVLCSEDSNGELERWRNALEEMKISRKIHSDVEERQAEKLMNEEFESVTKFKYLGSTADQRGKWNWK